jgi:integrase
MARGEWIDPILSKLTVGTWVRRWLDLQVQLKPTTRVRYGVAVRCQILPRWESVSLAKVTHGEVSAWVRQLSQELSPASVRYAYRVFSLSLAAAVKDGRMVRNAAEGVPLPRVVSRPKRFLGHEEVASLAGECGDYATLIRLLAYAGLRRGQVAALRVKRVDCCVGGSRSWRRQRR